MDRTIEFVYPPRMAQTVARGRLRTLFPFVVVVSGGVCMGVTAALPHARMIDVIAWSLAATALTSAIALSHEYAKVMEQWETYLKDLSGQPCWVRLTDESITLGGANGTFGVPWRLIRRVRRSSALCELTYQKRAFSLPVQTLDDESWSFICDRVKEFGGTCESSQNRR